MQDNHTPNPSPEQDYVSKSAAEIRAALREIAELTEWLHETQKALPKKVYDCLMAAPSRNEADALTWEIYWRMQDVVTTPIAEFYRMPIAQVRKIIGGAKAEIPCRTCGKKQWQHFDSRNSYKEALSGNWNSYQCDECKAKDAEKNEASRREYQAILEQRQRELEALKTMPYGEYLETDHWKQLRMDMLKRAKFACQLCAAKGQLHVHHKTYENRGNEPYSDLIVLCANCHAKFHDKLGAQS